MSRRLETRQTGRQTDRQAERETGIHTDRQTDSADIQTNRQNITQTQPGFTVVWNTLGLPMDIGPSRDRVG